MMTPDYQEIEHTADWAIRIRGHDLATLFVRAAQGMVALMTDSAAWSSPDVTRRIEMEAPDVETLLVDWLSEIIFFHETEGLLFTEFAVEEVTPPSLRATIRGGRGAPVKKEIKAVTYHNLSVQKTATGYQSTIVFDV